MSPVRARTHRKPLALFSALSLMASLMALAFPLAPSAQAAACNQNDVTTILVIDEQDPRRDTETSTLTVEARNAGGEFCTGVVLDYGDDGDTDGDPTTSDGGATTGASADVATNGSGQVTFTRTARAATTDAWRVWADINPDNDTFDGGEGTVTGTTTWYTPAATTLDCSPNTDTNPNGTGHTVTCNLDDQNGRDLAGVDVHIGVTSGPNTGTALGDGITDSSGNRSLAYTDSVGSGTDTIEGCVESTDNQDCLDAGETSGALHDSVTKTWEAPAATLLDAERETATNQLNVNHTIGAAVWDQFSAGVGAGTTINYEFFAGSPTDVDGNTPTPPDFSCTTGDGSMTKWFGTMTNACSITYTQSTTTGDDLVCVWAGAVPVMTGDNTSGTCGGDALSEGGDTSSRHFSSNANNRFDVVRKTWVPTAPAQILDCTPETDTNPTGTSHVVTCSATDASGATASTFTVNAEATGTNDPDGANTTGSPDFTCSTTTGSCSFTHGPAGTTTAGTTTYRAWISTASPDMSEGQDEAVTPGATVEPDGTDVVTKTWFGQGFAVTITPTSDAAAVGQCNPYTLMLTDSGGNPIAGATLDIHQTHADFPDDPTPPVAPALTFCTSGEVAAADPTAPNPSSVGTYGAPAGTQLGGHNSTGTNNDGKVTIGVESAGTGTVNLRAFCENATFCTGAPEDNIFSAGEPTATASKTWNPGGADGVTTLDAEPNTSSNPQGTTHTVTVTLTNSSGNPVNAVTPNSTVTAGPNVGTNLTCGATSPAGTTTCAYTDTLASPDGTDTIQTWVNQTSGGTPGADAGEPQENISKTWVPAPIGLALDLVCEGGALNDTQDLNERTVDPLTDCRNPLNDTTDVFTARVFDPGTDPSAADDAPKAGVKVRLKINEGWFFPPTDLGFAPPGGGFKGPLDCVTDAQGRCSVTVENATPADGDGAKVLAIVLGQVTDTAPGKQPGNNRDSAIKAWQAPSGQILTHTPAAATNVVLTSHTTEATLLTQFGNAAVGSTVSFSVTGRNNGVSGTGTTDANGETSFTYTDSGSALTGGTDTIEAKVVNLNGTFTVDVRKDWRVTAPTTTNVKLDNGGDQNGDTENVLDPEWENDTHDGGGAIVNTVGQVHTVVATAFTDKNVDETADPDGDPIDGAPITYTITGVGNFTQSNGDPLTGCPFPCKTITINMGIDNYATVAVTSLETGISTITASNGGQSESGDKQWTSLPARNIDCNPKSDTNPPQSRHVVTCLTTDLNGNPAPFTPVIVTETGPGQYDDVDCFSGNNVCTNKTSGTNGIVEVGFTTGAGETGTQTILVEVQDGFGTPLTQVPGTQECERLANDPLGSPAGNCDETVTKTWETTTPQCSDGADNDGDGLIDFPNDPGCTNGDDNDETNPSLPECSDGIDNDGDGKVDFGNDKGCDSPSDTTESPNPTVRTKTSVTIQHGSPFNGLVKSGKSKCERRRDVVLKKVRKGKDKRVGSDKSNKQGFWRIKGHKGAGTFYAKAKRDTFVNKIGTKIICKSARSRNRTVSN